MTKTIEYRVRPVTRYHVTRFESEVHDDGTNSGGCESLGEFDRTDTAHTVAVAMCSLEALQAKETGMEIEFKMPELIPFSDKERI